MKNDVLKQVISQIKKYELTGVFKDVGDFKDWLSKLDSIQINNFLSLDIDLKEIKNLKHLLINADLLSCVDYVKRVDAIATLKNGDGCWHLFDSLCKPNFLMSKNFYNDIEMLSKADTARYGLWILGEDDFINSPYHDEDLKLLIETHDIVEDNPLDFVVSDAIATVAGNIDSIKSPYHQEDMKLIATAGSNCLQMSYSYPEQGLNNLAINKVSLNDIYHLENMQILAKNPIASELLYVVMTNQELVEGKFYRKEVEALLNAKSKITALALYYYIVNPKDKYSYDDEYANDWEYDIYDAQIYDTGSVSGRMDSDYLNNLARINEIDDRFVMHFVSLLMNPNFINSQYKNFDLELLQNTTDKAIFMDLYRLMLDEDSLKSSYHANDALLISQSNIKKIRKLLLRKATTKCSLNNSNHEYDMKYISKLNLDKLNKDIHSEIKYYLFNEQGLQDIMHKAKLEKLSEGILVERSYNVSNYLDIIENQIEENKNDDLEIIESVSTVYSKQKSKILSLFGKR